MNGPEDDLNNGENDCHYVDGGWVDDPFEAEPDMLEDDYGMGDPDEYYDENDDDFGDDDGQPSERDEWYDFDPEC